MLKFFRNTKKECVVRHSVHRREYTSGGYGLNKDVIDESKSIKLNEIVYGILMQDSRDFYVNHFKHIVFIDHAGQDVNGNYVQIFRCTSLYSKMPKSIDNIGDIYKTIVLSRNIITGMPHKTLAVSTKVYLKDTVDINEIKKVSDIVNESFKVKKESVLISDFVSKLKENNKDAILNADKDDMTTGLFKWDADLVFVDLGFKVDG